MGACWEGPPSPTALPASLPSSATSPCPTTLTRASRGESPVGSTPVSHVAARQGCTGQPGWEYLPGILRRMCRLSQGCSGGVSAAAGQVQGSQRGAAVFVKEVAISLVCASANPPASEEKEPRWIWVVKPSSNMVQSRGVNSSRALAGVSAPAPGGSRVCGFKGAV